MLGAQARETGDSVIITDTLIPIETPLKIETSLDQIDAGRSIFIGGGRIEVHDLLCEFRGAEA